MRSRSQVVRDFVRQWLAKADTDLASARILAASDLDDYFTCAFHCQQATEKFIKAYLVRHQIEFRKTHDLNQLLELTTQIEPKLQESLGSCEWLTPFGVEFRYPGESLRITKVIADGALVEANHARQVILEYLEPYLADERQT